MLPHPHLPSPIPSITTNHTHTILIYPSLRISPNLPPIPLRQPRIRTELFLPAHEAAIQNIDLLLFDVLLLRIFDILPLALRLLVHLFLFIPHLEFSRRRAQQTLALAQVEECGARSPLLRERAVEHDGLCSLELAHELWDAVV